MHKPIHAWLFTIADTVSTCWRRLNLFTLLSCRHPASLRPIHPLIILAAYHSASKRYYFTMNSLETLAIDICRALQSQDWNRVDEIIDAVPDQHRPLPNATFMAGQCALHVAAEFDAPFHVIRSLTQAFGVESLSLADKFGNTPLHLMAISSTNNEALEHIAKAYPPAIVARNRSGRTPIDEIFRRDGDEDDDDENIDFSTFSVTTLLCICPDATRDVDKEGKTLLHRCLRDVKSPVILHVMTHLLVEQNKQLTEIADKEGVTAIHQVSKNDDCGELVEFLLLHTPRTLWTAQDIKGRTALHFAVHWTASADVIIALVKACPKLVTIVDAKGMNPMDYLVRHPDVSVSHLRQANEAGGGVLEQEGSWSDLARAFFVAGPYAELTDNGKLDIHAALYMTECPMVIAGAMAFLSPHKACIVDKSGKLPIHIAAQAQARRPTGYALTTLDHYIDVLVELCSTFPEGARTPDPDGKLPLTLMIESNQAWPALKVMLAAHPAAVLDQGLGPLETCHLLSRLNDADIIYRLLRDAPFFLEQHRVQNNVGE